MEMVIVDPEDLDCAKTGAIGWILSVLAIVAEKWKQLICCVDSKSQYYGQDICKNCKNVCWIVEDDCCNKKLTCPYSLFRSKICKNGLKK